MVLSLAAIRKQIAKLEATAKKHERSNSKGIQAAAKVISKYNLSMHDLKVAMKGQGRRSRSALAGKPVAPKYRDAKGNTWAGRGRAPLWLVAAVVSADMFVDESIDDAGHCRDSPRVLDSCPSKT